MPNQGLPKRRAAGNHDGMGKPTWTDTMDRVARSLWEVVQRNPEVNYIRAEVALGDDRPVAVLDADPKEGVAWVDEDGGNDRQVILPDGSLARSPEWLAKRREEGSAPG